MKLATWGSNGSFEGGTATRSRPNTEPVVASVFGDNIEEIAAAYHFLAARTADGRVLTVGDNTNGELGDGTHEDKAAPVDVGLQNIVKVAAGGAHCIALDVKGAVYTWGIGPLGDGRNPAEGYGSAIPIRLPVIEARDIATGGGNCFVIESDGPVTWGINSQGQIGDGTRTDKLTPVLLDLQAKQIACNGVSRIASHAIALLPDGRVMCWGGNGQGQSGQVETRPVLKPALVPGLRDISRVVAGLTTSFAITSTGDLLAWGKLPDGTETAVPKLLLSGVSDAVAGAHCVLAICEGTVWAAGNNDSGQLGDGTQEDKSTFTEVPGLGGVAELAIGQADDSTHVAALHLGDLAVRAPVFATPIPNGLAIDWEFGATEKPWQIKHRLPKQDWVKDGTVSRYARSYVLTGLETGKEYEVFVQNSDFGWHIVRGVAG